MLGTIWKYFFRCVVGLGILFVLVSILIVIGMSQPHVIQSAGETAASGEARAATISGALPSTATKVQYCRASAGLGGRLLLYRFSAPSADLHAHALAEFAAHFRKPKFKKTAGATSPINEQELELYKQVFGVNAEWMIPPSNGIGTLYESADGQSSHRPIIFIDDASEVLYFRMID